MTNVVITAPLHEETRGKIVTACRPVYRMEFIAWRQETEDHGPHGYGRSDEEAKRDLLEKERTCPKS